MECIWLSATQEELLVGLDPFLETTNSLELIMNSEVLLISYLFTIVLGLVEPSTLYQRGFTLVLKGSQIVCQTNRTQQKKTYTK